MITVADKRLKGQYVRFLVRDIYHPEPTAILHELHKDEEVEGKVLALSESAQADGSPFVMVKVPGVRSRCIVSVERLLRGKKAPVEL